MTAILNLAFALLAGLLMTRIFSRWHLPDVTAFLVTGVLIGPFVLGRLGVPGLGFAGYDQVEALSMISDVAMGFIAFSIGNEFRLSQLKKTGKQAMVIGVLQALAALAFVDIALVVFHFLRPDVLSVPAAITLGAIATATAPATTLMVVRQYKAKGELTDLLLPIVALDDAGSHRVRCFLRHCPRDGQCAVQRCEHPALSAHRDRRLAAARRDRGLCPHEA